MREILFRGKRLDNGEWSYGSYLFLHISSVDWTGAKSGKPEDVHYIVNDQDINYAVYPSTIGQYTGLKDKNGKKDFEGDIVKADNGHISEVTFHFGAFCCYCQCHDTHNTLWSDILTVIGNIHDNPELLEK